MLKTVTAYQIADIATKRLLDNIPLSEATAAYPDPTSWYRAGWGHPEKFGHSPIFTSSDNTRLLLFQVHERVLPGKVIKTQVALTAAEHERRQGYKCGRKQLAEIKEEVVVKLLPTSHVKPVDVLVMVTGDWLLIGTSSARMVDLIFESLRGLYLDNHLSFKHPAMGRHVGSWLTSLVANGSTDSGEFKVDRSVVLQNNDRSTARYKDVDLDSQSVLDSIASGMSAIELAITFNERMSFSMSDEMVIKRIKFLDVIMQQAQDDAQGDAASLFDGTVALVAGEMRELLSALLHEIPSNKDEDDEL